MYLASSSALQIDRLLKMLVSQFQHWLVPLGGTTFKNPVFLFGKSGSSSSLITTLLSESQTMFLSVISLHTQEMLLWWWWSPNGFEFQKTDIDLHKDLVAC